MRNRRGFALILTLIITTLLIALVTEFIHEVYVETVLRRSYRDGQQALLMADSGIMGGVRLLQTVLSTQGYTSLNDPWKSRPLHLEDERGVLDVFIDEESGKLNLNAVVPPTGEYGGSYPAGVLSRLLKRLKLPAEELLDPLADWIDENDEPHRSGAEAGWYGRLKPPYLPRNGPLQTLEELRLVKGFTGAVFAALRPYVTVYADTPGAPTAPININTASPEILASLDDSMSDDLVKRVMDRRKGEPFKSPADLVTVPGLEQIATGLQTRITTKGAVYRLLATARVGETARTVEAVVRVGGSQAEFLYWREY
jgi:general secretion pathway protein K